MLPFTFVPSGWSHRPWQRGAPPPTTVESRPTSPSPPRAASDTRLWGSGSSLGWWWWWGGDVQSTQRSSSPRLKVVCLWLTSDLLLQAEDDGDGLVQDQQLGLRLVALQVQLHHPAELLERLVDVAHSQPLPCVVGHPPLTLALHLLLRRQVLIVVVAMVTNRVGGRRDGGGGCSDER